MFTALDVVKRSLLWEKPFLRRACGHKNVQEVVFVEILKEIYLRRRMDLCDVCDVSYSAKKSVSYGGFRV